MFRIAENEIFVKRTKRLRALEQENLTLKNMIQQQLQRTETLRIDTFDTMEDLKTEFIRLISFLKPAGYDDNLTTFLDSPGNTNMIDKAESKAKKQRAKPESRFGGLLESSNYPRKESKESNYQLDLPEDFEDMHTRPHFEV